MAENHNFRYRQQHRKRIDDPWSVNIADVLIRKEQSNQERRFCLNMTLSTVKFSCEVIASHWKISSQKLISNFYLNMVTLTSVWTSH